MVNLLKEEGDAHDVRSEGVVVRVRGKDVCGTWCKTCIGNSLPFVGLVSETEYEGVIR